MSYAAAYDARLVTEALAPYARARVWLLGLQQFSVVLVDALRDAYTDARLLVNSIEVYLEGDPAA